MKILSEAYQEDSPEALWQACLRWAQEKDMDFRLRCSDAKVKAAQLSLAQLATLPLQPQPDAQAAVFSRLTLPLSAVARLMGSTPYLAEELEDWGAKSALWLQTCGISRGSVLLIADGLAGEGPGWGVLQGAEALQATVATLSEQPWEDIQSYGAGACALTARLLYAWVESGADAGICRNFFCLTSSVAEEQRQRWEQRLGALVHRQWGLPGLQASAVAWECPRRQGFHIAADSFWAETVDSVTLQALPLGETGELVLTALRRRSAPAIRMRTGCLGRLEEGNCRCGSLAPRFVFIEE